jgi:PAS domain S-box-containing protein
MAWRDVGELQRAQTAMRDTEELLRAVLLQVPAAVFIVEAPDGKVTLRSRMLDDSLGALDGDAAHADFMPKGSAIHPDGSPYALSEYPSRRALWHGETVRAEPMVYRRDDGRLIDLEMYAGPVHGDRHEVIAAVAVAIDVTERRRAEARQAFLYSLQDCLRELADPKAIVSTAAAVLGRYLDAARVGYGEMQPDDQTMLVINGYVNGAPPVEGFLPMSMLGPYHEARMRRGETLVYEDALADEHGARELGLCLGTRAYISAPLVRNGRLTGCLYVTHLKAHVWEPADVALVEAVAARIWDASERSRSEARLRESEERLRLVMESSGLGVWEYDATTGRTHRSPRHDEIFGYTEPLADWSHERFQSHVHPDDRQRVDNGFRRALTQTDDWDVEFRIVRADGSQGWAQLAARAHQGDDGRIERLLGTIADITERKTAADAVVETAAKFETLAQTLPNMIWTSMPDGRMEWLNDRVSEYCGLPDEALTPEGWSPVHPDDLATATTRWREALASGTPYVAEYRIRRHDGMFRWHITRAIPIRGSNGAIIRWIGSSADIQDQKSSEESLANLNASLEEQVRDRTRDLLAAEATLRQSQKMEAVGQLTGGIAHDFNNLLMGIIGSLELMSKRLEQGKLTEMGRYLQVAQTAAQRAASLTHRLLAFSRRQTLDPKPTDISELVGGIDELIRRTVGPAISVEVAYCTGLWTVLADTNQLESALLNLCLNARDAMPEGGTLSIQSANHVLGEPEASALELPAGEYVSLSVADTGVGMTADVSARAFDPFFTTKPMGQGTGLGLSMVYGFVRQSGGQARIRSAPGQGAQIDLYLPRHIGERIVAEQPADVVSQPRGDGQTILVVDDEPSVRRLIKDVLDDLGYHVLEAQTGADGLQILQSPRQVDLLVTDVGLPGGMNGRQLADAALSGRPELKILFITGYAERAVIGDHHLQPPMYLLTKPFTLESFGKRIEEIITAR